MKVEEYVISLSKEQLEALVLKFYDYFDELGVDSDIEYSEAEDDDYQGTYTLNNGFYDKRDGEYLI